MGPLYRKLAGYGRHSGNNNNKHRKRERAIRRFWRTMCLISIVSFSLGLCCIWHTHTRANQPTQSTGVPSLPPHTRQPPPPKARLGVVIAATTTHTASVRRRTQRERGGAAMCTIRFHSSVSLPPMFNPPPVATQSKAASQPLGPPLLCVSLDGSEDREREKGRSTVREWRETSFIVRSKSIKFFD